MPQNGQITGYAIRHYATCGADRDVLQSKSVVTTGSTIDGLTPITEYVFKWLQSMSMEPVHSVNLLHWEVNDKKKKSSMWSKNNIFKQSKKSKNNIYISFNINTSY